MTSRIVTYFDRIPLVQSPFSSIFVINLISYFDLKGPLYLLVPGAGPNMVKFHHAKRTKYLLRNCHNLVLILILTPIRTRSDNVLSRSFKFWDTQTDRRTYKVTLVVSSPFKNVCIKQKCKVFHTARTSYCHSEQSILNVLTNVFLHLCHKNVCASCFC